MPAANCSRKFLAAQAFHPEGQCLFALPGLAQILPAHAATQIVAPDISPMRPERVEPGGPAWSPRMVSRAVHGAERHKTRAAQCGGARLPQLEEAHPDATA